MKESGIPVQYSCLEKFHGQRSLAGYSPWGHKELDMTEGLTCLLIYVYGLGTTPKFINSSLTKIHIQTETCMWRLGGICC